MSVILMNNLNDSGKNYYIELTGSGQYSITTDPSRARLFKNITKAQGAMSSFSKILRKYAWFPVYEEGLNNLTQAYSSSIEVHNEKNEELVEESFSESIIPKDIGIDSINIKDILNNSEKTISQLKNALYGQEQLLKQKQAEYRQLEKELSEVDKELVDINHYIEFYTLSASKGYKIYALQQNKLQKRRNIKNLMASYNYFFSCFSNPDLETVQTRISRIDNQRYNPRTEVWKELKNL